MKTKTEKSRENHVGEDRLPEQRTRKERDERGLSVYHTHIVSVLISFLIRRR